MTLSKRMFSGFKVSRSGLYRNRGVFSCSQIWMISLRPSGAGGQIHGERPRDAPSGAVQRLGSSALPSYGWKRVRPLLNACSAERVFGAVHAVPCVFGSVFTVVSDSVRQQTNACFVFGWTRAHGFGKLLSCACTDRSRHFLVAAQDLSGNPQGWVYYYYYYLYYCYYYYYYYEYNYYYQS